MTNWEQPQRQSAVGIFLFAAKAFREFIGILLVTFGSLIRNNRSTTAFYLATGGFALLIFGRAILQYFYFRFYVSEHQLIVKKGVFARKQIIIPFERIQTVQLEQNLLHRLIDHYRVTVDTAGTDKTEVLIQSLPHGKAQELKAILTSGKPAVREGEDGATIIRLSAADLLKLAVSYNHIETIGLIVSFLLARFNDIKDWFGIDPYGYLEHEGKQFSMTARIIAIGVFFAVAIAILISVVRIVLRFGNLQITLTEKGFQLRQGVIHSKQQFIGAGKIQFIQWNANWVRRRLGMYMFHVKSTGEAEIKNRQKIQLPVTRMSILRTLAGYYQQSLPSEHEPPLRIQRAYAFRRTLIIGIPVFIVAFTILYFFVEWQALWALLWLCYFHLRNRVYQRNFRYWVADEGIEISTGVWGRQRVVLNWQKIQLVSISQGIYQRHHQLADLLLRTAAGDVKLPYITLQKAQQLCDFAAMKVESSQSKWM